MNNNQIAQANMFSRIKLFFTKYNTILSAFAPLAALITKFTNLQKPFQDAVDAQGIDTSGVADNKAKLKANMVKQLVAHCRKAKVWAKTTGNSVLEPQFNVTKTSFGISDQQDLALAQNLMTALKANAAALVAYNITAAQLTAADTSVADFGKAIGTPQQNAAISQTATLNIVTTIKAIIDVLHDVDDLLIPEFENTQPAMVAEYEANRIIGGSVSSHTAVTAHVYADAAHAKPILGAEITIKELNRHDDSDATGKADIVKFKAGNYTLVVKAKGHVEQSIPFSVAAGKHVEIEVVMNDGAVQGIAASSVKPAANAKVIVQGTNLYAITDINGKYNIAGIPEGNVTLKISTEGGDTATQAVTIVSGQTVVADWAL